MTDRRKNVSDRRKVLLEEIDFLFISRCDDVLTHHICGILQQFFKKINITSKIVTDAVQEQDIIASKNIILYRTSYFDNIKLLVNKYNKKIGFLVDDYVFGIEEVEGITT